MNKDFCNDFDNLILVEKCPPKLHRRGFKNEKIVEM
jgi:hypothetical protein